MRHRVFRTFRKRNMIGMLIAFMLTAGMVFPGMPGLRFQGTVAHAAPAADAGQYGPISKSQFLGSHVTLNGSGSTFVGTPTYEWYGPFQATGGGTPEVYVPEGAYTVSLIVRDNTGHSSVATASVEVLPCFNISARVKSGKVQLTWTNIKGTKIYHIYRADEPSPSAFKKIGQTTSTYSTYLDSSVKNEKTYLYVVGAYDGKKWCYSNVASSHPSTARKPPNYKPVIYSLPVSHGTTRIVYKYDVNATDPDGNPLAYGLLQAPDGMQINGTSGLITWTPAQAGAHPVTVQVSDGKGGSHSQAFTINVAELPSPNEPPLANAGEGRTITLDYGQANIEVTLDGTGSGDPDGDLAGYAWTGSPDPEDVAQPVVTLGPGSYPFTLVVIDDDGAQSEPDTVNIVIEAGAPPPEPHPPQISVTCDPCTVTEGGTLTVQVSATDPDGDPVTLSAGPKLKNSVFNASPGTQATGVFTFNPDHTQQGKHVVRFNARDPLGITDAQTIQITVLNANRRPTLSGPNTVTVDEGKLISIPVKASDPDGDLLTLSATGLPPNAIFTAATGTITFAPDFDQARIYQITCHVSDGQFIENHTVNVTVNDVPTGGTGQPSELVLVVDPVQSPTLLTKTRITGTVNAGAGGPPVQRITAALITGLSPATGEQGQTLQVTLSGQASGDFVTHFLADLSHASFGADVTVNSITVNGPTQAVAIITVGPTATAGPRSVTMTTDNETAVSMVAFNVTQGHANVTGTLMDPDSGLPIAGAIVSIQGTSLTTTTGADGTFFFSDVPAGLQTLIFNAPDHEMVVMGVDARVGMTVNLETIETQTTVFDPAAPAGATIFSVLGRGVGNVIGNITVEEARRLIIDTMILVGGNEAGVLDEFDNQLNPHVDGVGLTSMRDFGVQIYAERLTRGGGISLIELLYDISFAFEWSPRRPTYLELLAGLQNVVNRAWANPNNPLNALPVVCFNFGRSLSPNPPTITSTTQLTQFQAYLLINSFMAANYKEVLGSIGPVWPPTNMFAWKNMGRILLKALVPPAYAADDPTYTKTWADLKTDLGLDPGAPVSGVVTSNPGGLPAAEDIYRKYYLGMNTETVAQGVADIKQILINGGIPKDDVEKALNLRGLDEDDKSNLAYHYATEQAMELAKHQVQIQQTIALFCDTQWMRFDVQKGPIPYLTVGSYADDLRPEIMKRSLRPDPPFIRIQKKYSGEAIEKVKVGSQALSLPSMKISFWRSSQEKISEDDRVKFYYRLWRQGSGESVEIGHEDDEGKEEKAAADWVLLNVGIAGSGDVGAPVIDSDNDNLLTFVDPLPPPGRLAYRVDAVRIEGDATVVSGLTGDDLAKVQPWFQGFMDDATFNATVGGANSNLLGGYGAHNLHPGGGFLNKRKVWYNVSPLSNTFTTYMTGEPAGLRTFPRVDLAAKNGVPKDCEEAYTKDKGRCAEILSNAISSCNGVGDDDARVACIVSAREQSLHCRQDAKKAFGACVHNQNRVYVSIPSLGEVDRGSGTILEYDYETSTLSLFSRPGFMIPGQVGLAIDETGDLYTDNAASDAAYGGRIFRIRGATSSQAGKRDLVGSVNYYSSLNHFAHPTSVQQLAVGRKEVAGSIPGTTVGEYKLYIADANDSKIKTMGLSEADIANAAHNCGKVWKQNPDPMPFGRHLMSFTPQTDLAFDQTYTKLFVSQGSKVLVLEEGLDGAGSVASVDDFFTNTSGVTVCGDQKQYLFVADNVPGEKTGRIYRIPLDDIPINVPSAPLAKAQLLSKYTFLEGLDQPMAIAVADDSRALLIADNTGFRYLRFGFTGIALDVNDLPLIGAVVTVDTNVGTFSTTTDAQGYYHFTGINLSDQPQAMTADISHPDRSYSDRIYVGGQCHSNLDPAPCVNILQPADGGKVQAASITVSGVVLPKTVHFTRGTLFVDGVDYPVTINDQNEFSVPDVYLSTGENTITLVVDSAGPFTSGSSLPTVVTKVGSPPASQATAGVVYMDGGEAPRANATVEVFVNGDLVAETETDGCGYYSVSGLPLGAVSVNIVE